MPGLERLATARGTPTSNTATYVQQPPGYFDTAAPQIKERSTVGSASATGSIGGRTTWASGSDVYEADKMSEDQDDGVSSTGGFSDEGNASLVGFGEGASSTISGPVSTAAARSAAARHNSLGSPSASKASAVPSHLHQQVGTPMSGVVPSPPPPSTAMSPDPRLMDGMSYDANVVDTTAQSPLPVSSGHQARYGQAGDTLDRIGKDRTEEGGRKPFDNTDSRA